MKYYRVTFSEYNTQLPQRGMDNSGEFTAQFIPFLVKANNIEEVENISQMAIKQVKVHVNLCIKLQDLPFRNKDDIKVTFGSQNFYKLVSDLEVGFTLNIQVKPLKRTPTNVDCPLWGNKNQREEIGLPEKKGEPTYSMTKKGRLQCINTMGYRNANEMGFW